MSEDIRDKHILDHTDVIALSFVSASTPYVFRRHFRQGLRSHVMEVLNKADVVIENKGITSQGVRVFPTALPHSVFRIFRSRFNTLSDVWAEIERVKLVSNYLGPNFMAHSTEFIAEYGGPKGKDLLLCGFQDFIVGEAMDPWTVLDSKRFLPELFNTMHARMGKMPLFRDAWVAGAREKAIVFVDKIKNMILSTGHIPDLAGVGNLILTTKGHLCLVDINNISQVCFDQSISLDEKGYPVCDKSVEALSLIEEKIIGRKANMDEKIYKLFLDSQRMQLAKEKVAKFSRQVQS